MSFPRNILFAVITLFVMQAITASTSVVREGESSELQVQVVLPESLMEKLEGFEFVLDAYKNIVVKLKEPSAKEASKLQNVIEEMKRSYKNYGLYVTIPVIQGEFANKLEQLGFKLHDVDTNQKSYFIFIAMGEIYPN